MAQQHAHLFGTWELTEHDPKNTDKYLKFLGIAAPIRLVAKNMNQQIILNDLEDGQGVNVKTKTKLTSTNDDFYFSIARGVTTSDSRKSTVTYFLKEEFDESLLNEEDEENTKNSETSSSKSSSWKFLLNGKKFKHFLYKTEQWINKKGEQCECNILMKVTDEGELYCRMQIGNIIVNRMYKKS